MSLAADELTLEGLVRGHLHLARRAAARFAAPGWRREEAYADALLGLWRAALEYEPARGAFEEWARDKVRWAVLDGLRERTLGRRSPRPWYRPASLDLPLDGEGGDALGATVRGREAPPGRELEARELAAKVTRWMPARDRDALLSWLGGETMASIARRQGCCEARVSQRIKALLAEARELAGQGGERWRG